MAAEKEDSEESEDDMEDLRAKLKQAGLQRQREEEVLATKAESSEEEEEVSQASFSLIIGLGGERGVFGGILG